MPSASPEALGAAAARRLHRLGEVAASLFPETEPVPLRGREEERLRRLRAAAEALLLRPAAPGRPGPEGPGEGPGDTAALSWAAALRRRTAATLGFLGAHARAELAAAIERSLLRWDQAGDLLLLGPAQREAALELHAEGERALALLEAAPTRGPGQVALLCAAAEAAVAVDAACALLRAVELRFVILLRERLLSQKAAGPEAERAALLPDGEPFFDLGGALCAAAAALGWEEPAHG